MNNLNFLMWATVSTFQLLVLNVYSHKINQLESLTASLAQRVSEVESDLNQQVDELIRRQLIKDWESDDDYDPR